MTRLPPAIRPETWMAHVFSARSAINGGIVRRNSADIDRIVGRDRFLRELQRRGYHAVESAGQTIIFCNREQVHIVR